MKIEETVCLYEVWSKSTETESLNYFNFSIHNSNGKLNGISVLKDRGTILKKINVSFIAHHFSHGKYSVRHNIF